MLLNGYNLRPEKHELEIKFTVGAKADQKITQAGGGAVSKKKVAPKATGSDKKGTQEPTQSHATNVHDIVKEILERLKSTNPMLTLTDDMYEDIFTDVNALKNLAFAEGYAAARASGAER